MRFGLNWKMGLALLLAVMLLACDGGSLAQAPITPAPTAATPALAPRPMAPRDTDGARQLGANPPPLGDYARTLVYVDLVREARRFGSPATPWDGKALLGDDGWPIGDFGVFLMTWMAGVQGLGGTYTVLFEGRGKVTPVASPVRVKSETYDAASNTSTVLLDFPEGANQMALAITQTGSGIKHLRVIRPGYDPHRPPLFTQPFLDHMRRFKTLRMMDWLRTNNNPVSSWAERTDPKRHHTNAPNGAPWEHIIALARLTGQDLWINIPAMADDDYVLQLARLLKAELPPTTRLYVEYSNEVWNGQFKQHGQNWDMAKAEVAANPQSPLAFDGSRDVNQWGYRRIALRLKQISDVFRQVYGDAAMMTQVRPVFGTQVVNPYATELGLGFIAQVYGPPSRYFYAMAAAPYFNLGPDQRNPKLSTDEVLQAMERSIDELPRVNHFERNKALATWYQLPWLAYEGGPDTFGDGSIAAKKAANYDPRMQAICRRYLDTWYSLGGDLFIWFNAGAGDADSPYGAWELTPNLLITDTPKLRCVDGLLRSTLPALQGRNRAPGRFSALDFAGNLPPYSEGSKTTVRHLAPQRSLDYLVLAEQAGRYPVVLHAAAQEAGNTVDLSVNGTWVGTVALQAAGWGQVLAQPALEVQMNAGHNTLRLTTRTRQGGYDLQDISIQPASAPRSTAP